MSVNVNMKKMVVVVILIAIVCGGVWWYMETAPQRKAKAEVKAMIDFVQRQALEIAIIEQSSKLANYREQIAKTQKPVSPAVIEPKNPEPESLPKE